MSEKIGGTFGVVSTITLSDVNLYVGIVTGIVTAFCLFPTAVKNWRELWQSYAEFCENENIHFGSLSFTKYLFYRVRRKRIRAKSTDFQS